MGSVCCKQGSQPHDLTVASCYHTKPSAGDFLCEEIKSQFRLCPTRRRQKIKQRRRFKKRNTRKGRPSISSPKLLNPKFLTGEKWENVILTIPDPKMKTRTPVPPPRKKRKSLLNLCTKRNYSVEYVNLCSCEDEHTDLFDTDVIPEYRLYSSEPELFERFSNVRTVKTQELSNLRRTVSYEDVASSRAFYQLIKTSSDNTDVHILNSYINRCLLCYINDIMSLVEQLNKTNNEENKFKLDDSSGDENDEDAEKELMRESEYETEEQEDGTIETKLSEINEQKLLESLENFCIHCYLNKIQTHPKEREDISSTSRKVKENNLKSFQTGDNNNFSLANKNVGDKTTLMGNTHDKEKFPPSLTVQDKGSACANSATTESFTKPQNSSLDKKYPCLFCCINKKKTKQKHYNNGSLYEIYSKKQQNNVFKSDNVNEQECKYTIGNKVGDKRENKIRNEKLCEINNAQRKNIHDSNNMLEQFKNLNCCRRKHLNLFKYMCFQCFYVYVQILYILQSSPLFSEDFTSNIFKIRKCEILRYLSIKDIRAVVNMVRQIHSCYDDNCIESNICESCVQVLSIRTNNQVTESHFRKELIQSQLRPGRHIVSEKSQKQENMFWTQNKINKNSLTEDSKADSSRIGIDESIGRFKERNEVKRQSSRICNKQNKGNTIKNNMPENADSRTIKRSPESTQGLVETNGNTSTTKSKILQNFDNATDPSAAERRKNKFQILMADLNAKKIVNGEITANDKTQLITKESESRAHLQGIENTEVLDDNGNYLNTEHRFNQLERDLSKEHLPKGIETSQINTISDASKVSQDLTHTVNETDEDVSTKYYPLRRSSIKRKSRRLKRFPEANQTNSIEQISGELPSRRSSVTDSLYELETSLYDMLQNSCFSMDDVEYV